MDACDRLGADHLLRYIDCALCSPGRTVAESKHTVAVSQVNPLTVHAVVPGVTRLCSARSNPRRALLLQA